MGLTHLAVNMLSLYFVASPLIQLLGSKRFLWLYIGGGVAASLCSLAYHAIVPKLNLPASWHIRRNQAVYVTLRSCFHHMCACLC